MKLKKNVNLENGTYKILMKSPLIYNMKVMIEVIDSQNLVIENRDELELTFNEKIKSIENEFLLKLDVDARIVTWSLFSMRDYDIKYPYDTSTILTIREFIDIYKIRTFRGNLNYSFSTNIVEKDKEHFGDYIKALKHLYKNEKLDEHKKLIETKIDVLKINHKIEEYNTEVYNYFKNSFFGKKIMDLYNIMGINPTSIDFCETEYGIIQLNIGLDWCFENNDSVIMYEATDLFLIMDIDDIFTNGQSSTHPHNQNFIVESEKKINNILEQCNCLNSCWTINESAYDFELYYSKEEVFTRLERQKKLLIGNANKILKLYFQLISLIMTQWSKNNFEWDINNG